MSLRTLWKSYTAASSRSAANDMGLPPPGMPVKVGIDSARFLKLCQDGKLLDRKSLKKVDVDLVFTKFSKQRRLDFNDFQLALVEIALKTGKNGEELVEQLLANTRDGPSIHGTTADPIRLHDDKSTYTGVYKAGGPTTVDYEKQGMDLLCDRTKRATIRGVPEVAVYGPGGINVLMAPSLPCSPFVHLPAGQHITPSKSKGLDIHENHENYYAGDPEEKTELEKDDSTTEANIPQVTLQQIKHVYKLYLAASSRSSANAMGLPPPPTPTAAGIDSSRFLKLLKDGHAFGKSFKHYDVDVIFNKYADRRRLNFKGLCSALGDVAHKKDVSIEDLVLGMYARTADGPSIQGTLADAIRLHDDKNTYTGVYKAGGPTTTDYEKLGMDQLCDRTKKASVRGTPNIMTNGPGDKFVIPSAHNQSLEQSKEFGVIRAKGHGYSGILTGETRKLTETDSSLQSPYTPKAVLGKYAVSSSSKKRMLLFSPGTRTNTSSALGYSDELATDPTSIAFVDNEGVSHLTQGADVGLTAADMEITQEQADAVEHAYQQYELHSRSFKEQQALKSGTGKPIDVFYGSGSGIDSSKFHKLCVDASLFDSFFTAADVDIVFTKHRSTSSAGHPGPAASHKKMDFAGFQNALLEIAYKKGQPLGDLVDQISVRTADGPSRKGATIAEANRFYDDKSVYTGVAAQKSLADHALQFESIATGEAEQKSNKDKELDMSVTAQQLEDIEQIFKSFSALSKGYSHGDDAAQPMLDSTRFAKFCTEGNLFDKTKFTKEVVDIVFTTHKSAYAKRRMDFEGFQEALIEIATRKQMPLGEMIDMISTSAITGPANNGGTVAENNRFHDDVSTYTGAHRKIEA